MADLVVWLPRDVIRASGPDTIAFLQGQLSQDVAALAVGETSWSWLLQPQGKVEALLRVTRTGDGEVVLDTDGGFGPAVTARLNRFKLRTKCDLDQLPWRCLAVRGDAVLAPAASDGVLVVPVPWPAFGGFDVLGEDPEVPAGVDVGDLADYEAARIEAGVPVMGRELDERTIPQETGLVDRTVSFTKGCYTGQELVARLDARGSNVPRRLCRLAVTGDAVPPSGAALEADGKPAGEITSAARSRRDGRVVALGYVRRAVDAGAEVDVAWDGGHATAAVEALPALV